MSVLNRKVILDLLDLDNDDPCCLRVTPLLESDQVGADTIDIRLGSYFLVPRTEKRGSFIPLKTPGQDVAHRLHIPPGRTLVLPGKGVVLASAFEYLKMPCDVAAQVLTRSSIGRIFVTTATATLVHPGYRGCLTLEIVNLGNVPVELDILSRVAQLQLIRTVPQPDGVKDQVRGRYAAATEPEFPDFQSDTTEYRKLRAFIPGSVVPEVPIATNTVEIGATSPNAEGVNSRTA